MLTFNSAVLLLIDRPDEDLNVQLNLVNLSCQIETGEHHLDWFELEETLIQIEPSEIGHCSALSN